MPSPTYPSLGQVPGLHNCPVGQDPDHLRPVPRRAPQVFQRFDRPGVPVGDLVDQLFTERPALGEGLNLRQASRHLTRRTNGQVQARANPIVEIRHRCHRHARSVLLRAAPVLGISHPTGHRPSRDDDLGQDLALRRRGRVEALEELRSAFEGSDTAEEFADRIFVGDEFVHAPLQDPNLDHWLYYGGFPGGYAISHLALIWVLDNRDAMVSHSYISALWGAAFTVGQNALTAVPEKIIPVLKPVMKAAYGSAEAAEFVQPDGSVKIPEALHRIAEKAGAR